MSRFLTEWSRDFSNNGKGDFEKVRKIGNGICGMKMLKKKTRGKNWKDQYKPREKHKKPLKSRS